MERKNRLVLIQSLFTFLLVFSFSLFGAALVSEKIFSAVIFAVAGLVCVICKEIAAEKRYREV